MSVLNSADVSKVVCMLPKEVRKTLLKGECVLAGGFIRDAIAGNEINDIDLFPLYTSPVSHNAESVAIQIAFPYESTHATYTTNTGICNAYTASS